MESANTDYHETYRKNGYIIFRSKYLFDYFSKIMSNRLSEICKSTESSSGLHEKGEFLARDDNFNLVRDKKNRLLSSQSCNEAVTSLIENHLLSERDFITDEECLGYPNIYWRLVRKNSQTDVGPVHADKWFWDLNEWRIPDGYQRMKVWIPLIQSSNTSSFLGLCESHLENYSYSHLEDDGGKRRPSFTQAEIIAKLEPLPVYSGSVIIFHDEFLHGGRSTNTTRISIEFTVGTMNPEMIINSFAQSSIMDLGIQSK